MAIATVAALVATVGQADDYNFKFETPKKTKFRAQKTKAETVEPAIPVAPATPIAVPATPIPATVTTAVLEKAVRRSWFRMGFTASYLSRKDEDYYVRPSRTYNKPCWGGAINFNFSTSTVFGISLFLEIDKNEADSRAAGLLGVDFEINPFATDPILYQPLEFNFIAGLNSLALGSSHDSEGGIHIGGRFTYNFNQRFGLTSVARLSVNFQMLELGIITRL